MKNTKAKKQHATFDLAEGTLPSLKKEAYDWEKKIPLRLEPWHLTTFALLLDVCILVMYFFINVGVSYQVPIGYCTLILNFSFCVLSYILLKKKHWPINVSRFTKMINVVALCITVIVLAITLLIDSMA
ncbi:MAG: hypothetical protein ACRCWY_09755 [Cellulosilyticaceae bacterium]